MKLKKILEIHHQYPIRHSLKDNFGDGYLFEHNRIFRNIRKAAFQAGLKFSPDRFHHYESMPLTQLPKILETKTIPYVPNVPVLDEIEKIRPGLFELGELTPLKANYLHHESAHVLVRMIRLKRLKDQTQKNLHANRLQALSILIEEGFANACESLLCLDAGDFIHQEFLLKNTYIMERPNVRKAYLAALDWVGEEGLYTLLILSFLYANFLRKSVNGREFERILKFCTRKSSSSLKADQINRLSRIFSGAFDLDPVFTIKTNQFCLKLMGIDTDFKLLYDFDLMKVLESDQAYSNLFQDLGRLLHSGEWNG